MTDPDESRSDRPDTSESMPRWSVNPAVAYGGSAGVLLAGLALVTGRAEFALIALPFFVAIAFGFDRRPRRRMLVTASTRLRADDDGTGVGYRIRLDLPREVEAASFLMIGADESRHRFAVDRETAASLVGKMPVAHSGPQEIVQLHYSLLAAGGTSITSPDPGPSSRRLIPPPRLRMESLPMPHRVVGITGGHDSRTPGDGGEFRDVALFTPGDRLRRIDWKATARRAQRPGELYVRRTFSTADAIVVLVLDDRDELGSDVTRWAGARGSAVTTTSLDLAREAASSLAAAYVAAGDRVGLRDLAGTARSVEPGGGVRHLERLQSTISTAAPTGEPVKRVRTPLVPSSSLVIVLSTFLDDEPATMAITWASTGHRVIAVDVLPQTDVKRATREELAAYRLLMVERRDRIDGMLASGVERVRWAAGRAEAAPSRGVATGGAASSGIVDGGPGADAVPAVQLRMLSRPRRHR